MLKPSDFFNGVQFGFSKHCHSGIAGFLKEGHVCGCWRCRTERGEQWSAETEEQARLDSLEAQRLLRDTVRRRTTSNNPPEPTSNLAVKTAPRHRKRLIGALPTFMNQCEGGACGGEEQPDSFELAALAAMQSIDEIGMARRHSSQILAVLNVLKSEIDRKLREQL